MATLGAPRPRRSARNGNCSPTRAASSTRCCRRAVAVSTNSLLEDRARVQRVMRGCAPTTMSEAGSSLTAAHTIDSGDTQLGERCERLEQISEAWATTTWDGQPLDLTRFNVWEWVEDGVFRVPSLALGVRPRVWGGCGAARSSRAARGPLATRS